MSYVLIDVEIWGGGGGGGGGLFVLLFFVVFCCFYLELVQNTFTHLNVNVFPNDTTLLYVDSLLYLVTVRQLLLTSIEFPTS